MSEFKQLKEITFEGNKKLGDSGLVLLTWGNVSAIDRETGLVVIKPSGVSYETMKVSDMVVVDLQGNIVEGDLNPSSFFNSSKAISRPFGAISKHQGIYPISSRTSASV